MAHAARPQSTIMRNNVPIFSRRRLLGKQKISDEEDTRTEAVDRVVKRQRLLHLQLCIPDVDTVQIGDHIGDQQEGYETPIYFREDGLVSRAFQYWRCLVC